MKEYIFTTRYARDLSAYGVTRRHPPTYKATAGSQRRGRWDQWNGSPSSPGFRSIDGLILSNSIECIAILLFLSNKVIYETEWNRRLQTIS